MSWELTENEKWFKDEYKQFTSKLPYGPVHYDGIH